MDRFAIITEPAAQATFRLPVSRTPIIGRESMRAQLAEPIRQGERLITLVGAGGVGKTRLALAVAEDVRPDFEGRVGWVSLGELAEPDLLLDAITRSLEITSQSREPLDTLAAALGERPTLVVIDNMEHLVGEATVLGALLERIPALSLLVTSRVPLRLIGEREVRISPFPAISSSDAELNDHPAIRLFIERARAVESAFEPDRSALERIAAIVEQLDYLPLAIELAAARVRHFPLDEIQHLLSSSLDLLTGGPRDAPNRHRSIRGAIAWSYDLLQPEEQTLFRTLSVFPGGFSLDDAIALFSSGGSRVESLDAIGNLVDQNLLIRTTDSGVARYGMLTSIREFGQSQLISTGENLSVRDRFATLVAQRVKPLNRDSDEDVAWLEMIERSMGDVRAAFAWLVAQDEGVRALELVNALAGWWNSRGNPREACRLYGIAVPMAAEGPDALRFDSLRNYSWMLAQTGRIPDALELRAPVTELAERIGTPKSLVHAEQLLGALDFIVGDFESGKAHMQRAIDIAEDADVLRRFKGLIFNMASLSEVQGNYEAALVFHKRGLELLDRAENPGLYAMHLVGMASVALHGGDLVEANRCIRLAWPDVAEWRNVQVLVGALTTKGEILLEQGNDEAAAQLFGASDRLIEEYGRVLAEIEITEIAKLRERLADALGLDQLEQAMQTGRAMTMDELTAVIELPIATSAPAVQESPSLLTPRETEVVRLLVDGKTNPEIAAELFISERTVQSHVANVMAKLGVNSRTAVAARAVREGML